MVSISGELTTLEKKNTPFKEGDHEFASNKRPLLLLPVLKKICRKILLAQLTSFLYKHNLATRAEIANLTPKSSSDKNNTF